MKVAVVKAKIVRGVGVGRGQCRCRAVVHEVAVDAVACVRVPSTVGVAVRTALTARAVVTVVATTPTTKVPSKEPTLLRTGWWWEVNHHPGCVPWRVERRRRGRV